MNAMTNLIKIINEELNNFDFLNNDKYNKEQDVIELLKNDDLQKQFLCDSLLKKKDKIKILEITDARIGGNWNEFDFDNATTLTIEYFLKIQYTYDTTKDPLIFHLDFYGDNVNIGVYGWRDSGKLGGTPDTDVEPSSESWFNNFNWNNIDVTISTEEGDEIQFNAFKKAPPRIQTLFIREYTESFIHNHTGMDIKTKEMRDNVQNIAYC